MMKRDSESVHDIPKVILLVSSRAGMRPQVSDHCPGLYLLVVIIVTVY